MKVSTIFPVVLLTLVDFTAAGDFENQVACGQRFPRINGAIDKFCQKQSNGRLTNDLVCPSSYLDRGYVFTGLTGNKIRLRISGNCSPPQWIPVNYCVSQFREICAQTTNKYGYTWGKYGNQMCQRFVIEAA